MIRQLLSLIPILAACSAGAPRPAQPLAQPTTVPAAPTTTIDAEALAEDARVLSGDDYAGRETNRDGARKAAMYLSQRFAELGLSPMPGRDTFLVDYALVDRGFDPAGTRLAISAGGDTATLTAERDFAPFPFSDDGELTADVVFAGYGIAAEDAGWDDYAGLDVKGKVVLVLRHHPNEDREDGPLRGSEHTYFLSKAKAAAARGAVGMLLVTDPRHHTEADDLRMTGRLALPPTEAEKQERRSEGPRLLAMHVSREVAERLVASTGKSLSALQTALDTGALRARDVALDARAELAVASPEKPTPVVAHNVIGMLPGSDPARVDEWVVVGAHYDHLGAFDGEGDTVYNGADDNASGTAGMLALAGAFAALPARPARSVLFIGFSGEEKGLLGSRALIEQGILPVERVVFMLNLDMIGRNPDKPVDVGGDGYGTGLTELVTAVNTEIGLELALGGDSYAGNSDHHPFFRSAVPFLFLFTGTHDDYHQLGDHFAELALDRMARITQLGFEVARRVAAGEVTPRFVHRPFWLGAALVVESGKAIVTELTDDGRGHKAGLRVGDHLWAVGGAVVLDDATLTGALDVPPGTVAKLGIQRGKDKVVVEVERARPGYMGVVPRPLDDDTRQKLGLPANVGMTFASVEAEGPAAKAGLRAGDVVVAIDGEPASFRVLMQLGRRGAGERVTITVQRGSERLDLPLILGERPTRD